jgi:hypothetical protein
MEETSGSSSSTKHKRLYSLVVTCLALLVALLVLYWQLPSLFKHVDRSNESEIALAFFNSLLMNDVSLAKSLATEDLYSEIDQWALRHTVFSCPFAWIFTNADFLEGTTGGGTGICLEQYLCSYYEDYACYRSNIRVYYFSMNDITLKQIEGNWVVTGWGEVCEAIGDDSVGCN